MTTVAHWYHLRLSVLMAGGGGGIISSEQCIDWFVYRTNNLESNVMEKILFEHKFIWKKNKEKSQTFRRDFVFRCQCYAARIFFCSYGMGFGVGILIQNSIFYRQIFKSVKWKVPLNLFCVDNHFLRISKSEIA